MNKHKGSKSMTILEIIADGLKAHGYTGLALTPGTKLRLR